MRRHSTKTLLTIALSVLLVSTESLASNGKECPPWIQEDGEILKHSGQYAISKDPETGIERRRFYKVGPDLRRKVFLKAYDVWLSMPLGYIQPWPIITSDDAQIFDRDRMLKISENQEVRPDTYPHTPRFAFWMPDLRYLERNMHGLAWRHPCESGRPKPSNRQFIVDFHVIFPPGGSDFEKSRASLGLQSAMFPRHKVLPQSQTSERAIEVIINGEGKADGTKRTYIYSNNTDLMAMFDCDPYITHSKLHPALCRGFVWQRGTNTSLKIRIPSEDWIEHDIDAWKKPAAAAVALVNKWRVKSEAP